MIDITEGKYKLLNINKNGSLELKKHTIPLNPGDNLILTITNDPSKPATEVNSDEITGDEIFEELLHSFNTTLYGTSSSKYINNSKATTYNYLLEMYNIANGEWDTGRLFNEDLFPEAVSYRNGVGSGDTPTYKAMQAWLIASCLAEIIPTTGDNNIQTDLFNCAYKFGNNDLYKVGSADDNGNIIKTNNYGLKEDATIARYVASIIYAINHDSKVNTINQCRKEFKSNCLSTTDDSSYFVDGDKIFGAPPGPFTTTLTVGNLVYRPTNKKPTKQSSALYFDSNPNSILDWYQYNYKMDVAIDKYVYKKYNCYGTGNPDDADFKNDPIDISDRTQINHNAFNNNDHKTKQTIVEAGIVPCASDFVWHGKKRIKYVGVNKYKYQFPKGKDYIYMHNFELTSETSGDNVFEYVGAYYIESKPNLWYSNPQISTILSTENMQGNPTADMEFMCKIRDIADNNREKAYSINYGRRRPLGGKTNGSLRRSNKQDAQVNGINKHLAARFCVDTKTKYNNLSQIYKNPADPYNSSMYADDFPHDRASSWPSGHAAQSWCPALYLCQMLEGTGDALTILKRSYWIGTLRSIARFHWNSDILYGRLWACMLLPMLNANKNFTSKYNSLKQKLGKSAIPTLIDGGSEGGDVKNNVTPINNIAITFTLRIINQMSESAKFNGEFYMFMDCYENGQLTSDNTGKHVSNGGLTLISNPNVNTNSIVINGGAQRDFTISIPSTTINRLSTNVSPKTRTYGHNSNVVLYSYGKWPNSSTTDGWQYGGLSDAYKCSMLDNNANGFTLTNGSTHTLYIQSKNTSTAVIL